MKRRSLKPDDPAKPQPLRLLAAPDVTPLLGILLVIVVSFMAALPSPKTLDVQLPVVHRNSGESQCDEQIVVAAGKRQLTVNEIPVDQFGLERELARISEFFHPPCNYVYVVAEQTVPYGQVAHVIDVVKRSALRANIADTILLAGFSEQGEKKDQREA